MTLQVSEYGPPQRVYVENDWYDGPRAGVADLCGKPHRFVSLFDELEDEYTGTFLVWPIDDSELVLEQEQWEIFVSWNEQYEAGQVGTETHPGHSGTNKRWDEINTLLATRRESPPIDARHARAQMVPLQDRHRYESSGPAYQLSWVLI